MPLPPCKRKHISDNLVLEKVWESQKCYLAYKWVIYDDDLDDDITSMIHTYHQSTF